MSVDAFFDENRLERRETKHYPRCKPACEDRRDNLGCYLGQLSRVVMWPDWERLTEALGG